MWDPAVYLKYSDERSRPFGDLLARVAATDPTEVVDLGCGPGTLTVGLTERWPRARVMGLDTSTEMIDAARALGSGVRFEVADVRDWRPGPDVDVVLSNAVLHWVPGHDELLVGWARALRRGATLAFQVPGNFDSPSHRAIFTVGARSPYRALLDSHAPENGSVLQPTDYAALLLGAGCAVDAWETTYIHLLPATGADHPVLSWIEGTALRPVRAALPPDLWQGFRAEIAEQLAADYRIHNGLVSFPFRRIFVVARTPSS